MIFGEDMNIIVAVTDRKLCKDLIEQVRAISDAKVDAIILREKDLSEKEYRSLVKEIAEVISGTDVVLFVNTFIETAIELKMKNIQLSFENFKSNIDKRSYFDSIWVSVHSVEEAMESEALGADLIIYGNVFETDCKPGLAAKGLKNLETVCSSVSIPVLGIGGIDGENAKSVIKTGAKGVCLMSAFMSTDRPSEIVSKIRN